MTTLDAAGIAAVQAADAEIGARLAPGRRDWIIAILSRLSVHYPAATKDGHAFGLTLSDMADDLAEFSEANIVQACANWRRSEQWFPKSCDLIAAARNIRLDDQLHKHRCDVLLGRKPPKWWEEAPKPPSLRTYDAGPVLERLGLSQGDFQHAAKRESRT